MYTVQRCSLGRLFIRAGRQPGDPPANRSGLWLAEDGRRPAQDQVIGRAKPSAQSLLGFPVFDLICLVSLLGWWRG